MIIDDPIIGELEFNYIWSKDMTIDFLGKQTEIALIVDGDEDGKFGEEQYEVYTLLMRDWENIQHRVLQPILDYYIERRQELGYDVGFNEDYPLLETTDQLLEKITLDGIIVKYPELFEFYEIGLTFNCTWDEENGVGVRLMKGNVIEVGFQDVVM